MTVKMQIDRIEGKLAVLVDDDENIYNIPKDFFGEDGTDLTVEGVHPTDAGYYFMAKGIGSVLKPILENEKN